MASIRKEFRSAASFLANLAGLGGRLTRHKIATFQSALERAFHDRYQSCWYPDQPLRGSGNRCIRVHSFKVDPLLARVASDCYIDDLKSLLPQELVMWVDPKCVCYKLSECSPTFMVYQEGVTPKAANVVPAHKFEVYIPAPAPMTVTMVMPTPMPTPTANYFARSGLSFGRSAIVSVNA